MLDKYGYPTGDFFVAHHRFTGPPFPPEGTWGDILGGPADEDALIEALIETYRDEVYAPESHTNEPAFSNLRVWHIVPGKPAEECTAWAIKTMRETIADRTDEEWIE